MHSAGAVSTTRQLVMCFLIRFILCSRQSKTQQHRHNKKTTAAHRDCRRRRIVTFAIRRAYTYVHVYTHKQKMRTSNPPPPHQHHRDDDQQQRWLCALWSRRFCGKVITCVRAHHIHLYAEYCTCAYHVYIFPHIHLPLFPVKRVKRDIMHAKRLFTKIRLFVVVVVVLCCVLCVFL